MAHVPPWRSGFERQGLGLRIQGFALGNPLHPVAQLLHRNVQRFRGGLVCKAHRLYISLNSRLESNKEAEKRSRTTAAPSPLSMIRFEC